MKTWLINWILRFPPFAANIRVREKIAFANGYWQGYEVGKKARPAFTTKDWELQQDRATLALSKLLAETDDW